MNELEPDRRVAAVGALFAARVVYAFNWYNVGAVLPLIGLALHANTAELGLVLGAFLVGVALFQVPAGIASVRFGPRRVSLVGIAIFGASGVASAFAPSWEGLAALRFVGGVGAAFFFSPALSLVASYYPASKRGPVIGLYNGGFSVGGAAGLFVGAAVGVAQGWPAALGYGGATLLATTAIALLVVPTRPDGPTSAVPRTLRMTSLLVLRSRSIWALSIALTGFWGAVYVVAQYFVDFAETVHRSWGISMAALLTAVVVLVSFPGGPFGGWVAERGRDRRALIGLLAAGASVLVLLIPFSTLAELWPTFLLLGFLDGMIFAILYLIPTYLPETQSEGLALGVAVVNSIQVLLGGAVAIAFGFIAVAFGYSAAWIFAAALSAALLPLLALVRPNRADGKGGEGAGPDATPSRP